MIGWRRWLCVALALIWASATFAQDLRSPILTIDSERLYRDSAFGQSVLREIEAQTSALVEENRALETQLETEELALTEQRQTLPAEEFKELADAFDARVQGIRREREAKGREVSSLLEQQRDQFLGIAIPVLEAIMREAGASIVLEKRSVFISANAIDITDTAIERIDAVLPDSTTAPD